MNRQEVNAYFKQNPELASIVKAETGRNWTNHSTKTLLVFIKEFEESLTKEKLENDQQEICNVAVYFGKLLNVLRNKKIILPVEIDYILN